MEMNPLQKGRIIKSFAEGTQKGNTIDAFAKGLAMESSVEGTHKGTNLLQKGFAMEPNAALHKQTINKMLKNALNKLLN